MNKNSILLLVMSLFSLQLYFFDFPLNSILDNLLFFLWIMGGVKIVLILFKSQNYLISIFIFLNLIASGYFFYVYSYYDVLLPQGPFDFSAYSVKNLHNANNLMYLIFSIIYFTLLANRRNILKRKRKMSEDLKIMFIQGLRKLYYIKSSTLFTVIVLILIIDILIFLGTFNVYRGQYGVAMQQYFHISNFLRAFIGILSFFIYVIVKVKNNMKTNFTVLVVKLFFFFTLFFAILSYGSRGSVVGLLGLALIFDILTDRSKSSMIFNISSSFLLIIILVVLWPIMRNFIYIDGFAGAFVSSLHYVAGGAGSSFKNTQFSLIPMIPMTLFHFLYVSDLISNGVSLNYSTFINLIPQQIPSFIADAIGYVRPLNDNWRLADYYFHGGGFYIFANAYWNGGVIPLVLFTYAISQILIWIEVFFKNNHIVYYLAYPLFIYLIPVNTFYGIQPLIRGLEYGFVAIFIVYIFKNVRIKA